MAIAIELGPGMLIQHSSDQDIDDMQRYWLCIPYCQQWKIGTRVLRKITGRSIVEKKSIEEADNMVRDTYKVTFGNIPVYDPQAKYKIGDLAYFPKDDMVGMCVDHEDDGSLGDTRWINVYAKRVGMLREVRCDSLERGRYPWGSRDTQYSNIPRDWLKIKKVVFNEPATIVFWEDGTKTVVKCSENEDYDPEKGLMAAIVKKAFGNQGNYYNEIKKWLPEKTELTGEESSAFKERFNKAIDKLAENIRKANAELIINDPEQK